jgi:DNA-binding NarL/FixJ family response regulator
MITVLIADDQPLVRAGFRSLLDSEADIEVVGTAADGLEAIELAIRTRPDIIFMDVRMPRLNGLDATARIVADPALDGTRVVVLTTFELDEYVFGALRAGASGFLLKDIEPQALIDAVRLVAAGQSLLAPAVTRVLIEAFIAATPDDPSTLGREPVRDTTRLDVLTPREREILALVGTGMSNQEIAARLVLSPLTVKTHVSRLLLKLDARDRPQLVVLAYETGLVGAG